MGRAGLVGAVALTAAFISDCGEPFPEIRDWNSLVITLSRGVCYGTCPVYHVEIHGDGKVEFNGNQYVAQPGHHEAQIPAAAVRALVAKFRAADFFALKDNYHGDVTDWPSVGVSIRFDGREKSVGDYAGHMAGMPDAVSDLEHAIDEAAGTERWIKGPVPAQ